MTSNLSIEQAEIIVSEYGKLLSTTSPSIYGIPISTLPFDKEEIKIAIQMFILAVDKKDTNIQDSLSQAYVYLAQFIPDDKVKIAEEGRNILELENINNEKMEHQNTDDLELANQALQTINEIKIEMESLMSEIRLLIP